MDRSTFSLHYVHAYAALDRVDFSGLSDVRPTPMAVDLDKLLPLAVDVTEIENHFSILITRLVSCNVSIIRIIILLLSIFVCALLSFNVMVSYSPENGAI